MTKVFSPEDADLSTSIRVVKEREYSDLDLTLSAKTPAFGYASGDTGDVLRKTDAAAVKQSIKNLLLTNRYEKPYRPNYGGDLSALLFELADEDTGNQIIQKVKSAIQRYEPRAKILSVKVTSSPDMNQVSVIVEFRVVQTGEIDLLRVRLNEPQPEVAFAPPITPPIDLDTLTILNTENLDRLLTLQGLYLAPDLEVAGLLTQANEQILTQDGFFFEL